MGMFDNLILGFQVALHWSTLLYCLLGVTVGTFVGVLPGIGGLAAISILLPITFHIEPTEALIMLSGIFYGALYGGSTASILLNVPGTPATAVTCMDGYPMARQGRAGVALFTTTVASFVGGSLAIVAMTVLSPPLARMAISFGAAEYFSMMLLGLVAASTLSTGSPTKGIVMVVLGLILGVVGIDAETGYSRFTFGSVHLLDGMSLVALAVGLLGVSEIIARMCEIGTTGPAETVRVTLRSLLPTWKDVRDSTLPTIRGSALGIVLGALPGTGAAISSFMSYAIEKKIARDPSRFGRGAIEGIAAPEASNNAAAQAAFIPTLTLGVPGDAIMALMLAAMMIHGVQPGPRILVDHPDIFWGLVASFWIGNFMLLVLNIPLIGIWVRMLSIPHHVLYPAVILFAAIGVYSVRGNVADVYMLMIAGGVGYLLSLFGFTGAPLLLGFILGPLMEENLRRALLISGGDATAFVTRPISAAFLAATALVLIIAATGSLRSRLRLRRFRQVETSG